MVRQWRHILQVRHGHDGREEKLVTPRDVDAYLNQLPNSTARIFQVGPSPQPLKVLDCKSLLPIHTRFLQC